MRIKTQFTTAMALFAGILVVVAVSAIVTNQKVEQASRQERIASAIAQGASDLGHLSTDYLIYRESQQLARWQSGFAAFSGQVAVLQADTPEQQALVAGIRASKDRMKAVFDSAAATSGRLPGNGGEVPNPAFLQVSWSRMAIQSQALAADALRLSKLLNQERDRLTDARTFLLYAMIGLFGVFLLASYLFTYQRILKSIAALRAGAAVIGSGNLDFTIEERKNDEIGELSHAMNQMASDLKAVTASRADLEREIAERKRVEEAVRRNEGELIEAQHLAHLGNWYWNVETDATTGSDELLRIYGLDPEKESMPDFKEQRGRLYPVESWERVNEAVERAVAMGIGYELDVEALQAGKEIWITTRGEVVRDADGRVVGMRGTVQDVTERKRAEAALAENSAKLEETNRELESFSYSVSHDLRAPLRAIDGFSQMILKKDGEQFGEETRRRFRMILDNVATMGTLIDDLLAFSRLGRQELAKGSLDMEGLVRDVWGELVTINPGREMTLKMAPIPAALGDRALIRQVYSNLLGNAAKFTQSRTEAVIEAGSSVEAGGTVYYIRDNGVGFDMQFYDKLFGVFQRLHSDADYKGTGIGLALVQRIVQKHGGRVWAEGRVDEGATFYFTLPDQS